VYDSYRGACDTLVLLPNDREFVDAIHEISIFASGAYIRKVFTNYLICSSLSDPLHVWEQTWETLAEGILYDRRRMLNSPGIYVGF
jgi:hypothetical protein